MNTITNLVASIIEGSSDSIQTAVQIAEALPLVQRKLIVELAREVEVTLGVNGRCVGAGLEVYARRTTHRMAHHGLRVGRARGRFRNLHGCLSRL